MTKRRIMLILGVLISCAGLYWALHGVEWVKVRQAFSNPRLYLYAVPFVALTLLSMWARSARAYFLLRHEARLGQWPLYKITMIGFAYNSIMPARAGEFIRAYLLGRQQGLGFVKAGASLVVERLYDLLMILLCFMFALMSVRIAPDLVVDVGGGFVFTGQDIAPLTRAIVYMGVAIAAGMAFFLFGRTRSMIARAVQGVPWLPPAIKARLCAMIESFSAGLRSVRDPLTVFAVVALSFLVWYCVAASVWVLQFGFPGLNYISLSDSFAIAVLICFAVILPSGPAYFGMYEAGGIFALLVLSKTQDRSLALSFTLAMHLLQILPIIALGLLFAVQDHISIRRLRDAAQ